MTGIASAIKMSFMAAAFAHPDESSPSSLARFIVATPSASGWHIAAEMKMVYDGRWNISCSEAAQSIRLSEAWRRFLFRCLIAVHYQRLLHYFGRLNVI